MKAILQDHLKLKASSANNTWSSIFVTLQRLCKQLHRGEKRHDYFQRRARDKFPLAVCTETPTLDRYKTIEVGIEEVICNFFSLS